MSDRIFGLFTVLVALGFIASATQVQSSFMTDPVGPKLFPMIIGGVAALCGVLVILKPDGEPQWPALRVVFALFVCTVVLIGYAYALKPLGFLIPTALASGVLSYQIQNNIRNAALTGIGLSLGLFAIFKYALGLGLFAFSRQLTGG